MAEDMDVEAHEAGQALGAYYYGMPIQSVSTYKNDGHLGRLRLERGTRVQAGRRFVSRFSSATSIGARFRDRAPMVAAARLTTSSCPASRERIPEREAAARPTESGVATSPSNRA